MIAASKLRQYRPCAKQCSSKQKLSHLTCCKVAHGFYDRVDMTSANDRVFYVYALGTYNNTPVYIYGETDDILSVELDLKRTVPMYTRVVCAPSHEMLGVDVFEDSCKANLLAQAPLLNAHYRALTAPGTVEVLHLVWKCQRPRVRLY